MRWVTYAALASIMVTAVMVASCSQAAVDFSNRWIELVSVKENVSDFKSAGMGLEGYFFPQFGAEEYVQNRPPDENMRFVAPDWAGFQFNVLCNDRTFSLDAGIRSVFPLVIGVCSEGGNNAWERFILPDGEEGHSGSIVDYATCGNTNNTVNRIQLRGRVPLSFLMSLVVDNRAGTHNRLSRFRMRGASSDGLHEVDVMLTDLTLDNKTDVYTFRFSNFEEGDFIKIQFNSGDSDYPAGFAGIMFDLP